MSELTETNLKITERKSVNYTDKEKRSILRTKKELELNIERLTEEEKLAPTYYNQQEAAQKIIEKSIKDPKIVITQIYALTQSGKTGILQEIIHQLAIDEEYIFDPRNTFILTGLSSIDWREQTRKRIPDLLKDNIYHRTELEGNFLNKIRNLKNVLILMDEVQIAAKGDQTIAGVWNELKLTQEDVLYKNDIKIIEITATPDGTAYDLQSWNSDSIAQFIIEPGEGYTSCFDLLQNGKVYQYKDLSGHSIIKEITNTYKNIFEECEDSAIIDKDIESLKKFIIETSCYISKIECKTLQQDNLELLVQEKSLHLNLTYDNLDEFIKETCEKIIQVLDNYIELKNTITENYDEPKCHIIRTKKGIEQEYVKEFLNMIMDDCIIKCYDQTEKFTDINDIIKIKPTKDTFILVKEKLRCAITLEFTEYLGIMYERKAKQVNDSSIIQGLLGRVTGYKYNNKSIIFTNIETIHRYKAHWDSKFMDKTLPWTSNTTKFIKDELVIIPTFNVMKSQSRTSEESSSSNGSVYEDELLFEVFDKYEEVIEYCKNLVEKKLIKRHPQTPKVNTRGFYEVSVTTSNSNKEIRLLNNLQELYYQNKLSIQKKVGYKLYPCYTDITDKSSVKFLFLHKN